MLLLKSVCNLILKPVRKVRKKISKIEFNSQYRRFQNIGADCNFPKGTADWLIHREILFGGIQKGVPRRRVSPHDPRTEEAVGSGGMRGGDRMLFHGYAKHYSKYLASFNREKRLVIAEFGILRVSGLAIWCDLFPNARVLGFDIDTSHFEENRRNLLDRGAFSSNVPETHTYVQFVQSEEILSQILQGDTIDICIDDGCHMDEAILCTLKSIMPHLSKNFLYFIEDNSNVHKAIESQYPDLAVSHQRQMTIISRTH